VTNDAPDHVYTLDKCQLPGQIIYIQDAYIRFSNGRSTCGTYVRGCNRKTNHRELMNCNGKHNCTFSQNVFNLPEDEPLCTASRNGNYLHIKYNCIIGKNSCHIA